MMKHRIIFPAIGLNDNFFQHRSRSETQHRDVNPKDIHFVQLSDPPKSFRRDKAKLSLDRRWLLWEMHKRQKDFFTVMYPCWKLEETVMEISLYACSTPPSAAITG